MQAGAHSPHPGSQGCPSSRWAAAASAGPESAQHSLHVTCEPARSSLCNAHPHHAMARLPQRHACSTIGSRAPTCGSACAQEKVRAEKSPGAAAHLRHCEGAAGSSNGAQEVRAPGREQLRPRGHAQAARAALGLT